MTYEWFATEAEATRWRNHLVEEHSIECLDIRQDQGGYGFWRANPKKER